MAEIEYGGIKVGGSKLLLVLPLIGTLGGGLWGGFEFYKDYMDMKGDLISNEDIATIYPIFSILEDYDKLIDILSISISRDNTNVEYLEVLRSAYMKKKDYENAERIYQMILNLE